ncbi:HEXIM1 protein [Sarcoptes scabiei]|nr:HEXIM1 protein [Sarcoptes scabiei]
MSSYLKNTNDKTSSPPPPPPIGFIDADDDEEPGVSSGGQPSTSANTQNTKPKIKLTWIDKIFRFFYSKEEFEAYLIEKELKRRGTRLNFLIQFDINQNKFASNFNLNQNFGIWERIVMESNTIEAKQEKESARQRALNEQ